MTKSELLDILIKKLNKFDITYEQNVHMLNELNNGKCFAHTLELRKQKTINNTKTLNEFGLNCPYNYDEDVNYCYQVCLEYVVMESIYIKDNKANFNTETIIFDFIDIFKTNGALRDAKEIYNKILKTYKFVDSDGRELINNETI